MRCRRAEKLVSDSLDSGLSGREARELTAHLAGCPSCRSYKAGLGLIQKAASATGESPVPAGYWEELSARVRGGLGPEAGGGLRPVASLPSRRWAWLGVPAAVAGLLLSLHLFRSGQSSIPGLSGPEMRLEPAEVAGLEDAEVAGELDGLVSAALRDETGYLSPYELPDLADDPGFWDSLTDDEVLLIDREIGEDLGS